MIDKIFCITIHSEPPKQIDPPASSYIVPLFIALHLTFKYNICIPIRLSIFITAVHFKLLRCYMTQICDRIALHNSFAHFVLVT